MSAAEITKKLKAEDELKRLAEAALEWWQDEKCDGLEIQISFRKKKPEHIKQAERILSGLAK